MKSNIRYSLLPVLLCAATAGRSQDTASYADPKYIVADNMVIYQHADGGWPKHIADRNIDYTVWLNKKQQSSARKDAATAGDATIDNNATTREIRFLLKAYNSTHNQVYLAAAENGIRYLYRAQYSNGGWPQFYPDRSLYRAEITFNDNAMINVLNLLLDLKLGINDLGVVSNELRSKAGDAIDRGINIILKTQLTWKGKPAVWCQQYDETRLTPAKARAYELPAFTAGESVGIITFLMRLKNPSPEIKAAINNAVAWLEATKINGYKFVDVPDASAGGGKNKILVKDPASVIWARYYDLDTNEPFFCGRDGIKKKSVMEIEPERRNGYAWYGNWAEKLITKDYPEWVTANK